LSTSILVIVSWIGTRQLAQRPRLHSPTKTTDKLSGVFHTRPKKHSEQLEVMKRSTKWNDRTGQNSSIMPLQPCAASTHTIPPPSNDRPRSHKLHFRTSQDTSNVFRWSQYVQSQRNEARPPKKDHKTLFRSCDSLQCFQLVVLI
jgi:hypothetical protein